MNKKQCSNCNGSGHVPIGERYVTRDMAIDAGEPDREGSFFDVEWGRCPVCDGDGIMEEEEEEKEVKERKNKPIMLFIFVNFLLLLLLLLTVAICIIVDNTSRNVEIWEERHEEKFTQELDGILSAPKLNDGD